MLSEDSNEGFGRQGDRRKSDMEAMVNRMITGRWSKQVFPQGRSPGACRKGWRRKGWVCGRVFLVGQAHWASWWGCKLVWQVIPGHGGCKIMLYNHAAAALQRCNNKCNGYLSLSSMSEGPGA